MVKRKIQCPISEFKSSKSLRKDTFAEQEKKSKCLGYLKLKPIKELDESNLPSNRQVLKHFFCFTKWSYTSNIPKKKIAEKPLIEINERYSKIPCPTKTNLNASTIFSNYMRNG